MDIIAGGFGLVVNSAFQGISQDPDDLIAALLDCDITPCDDSPGDNVVQNGGFADYMSAVANSGNAEILTNVFVQVEEYFDASISVRQAAKLVAAGGRGWSEGKKRLLNLVLTDGVHTLPAIEFTRCPALDRVSPGCKLLLAPRENAPLVVTRGRLLLRADNVQYLGGTVRELAEADAAYWRERMLEVVGKPYVVRQHSSQPQVSGVPQQAPQVAASSHVQRQPQQQQPAQQQQPPQHQPFQQGRASPPPPQQQRPQPFQAPPPQQQPQPFHPQQQPFQQRASPTPQFQQPAQPTNLLELDDDTTPIKRSQSSSPSVSQTPRFAQEVFTYWSDVLEQRGSQRDTPLDVSIRGYFVEVCLRTCGRAHTHTHTPQLAGTLVYQHGHYQLRVIADDGTQLQEVTLTDEFLTKYAPLLPPPPSTSFHPRPLPSPTSFATQGNRHACARPVPAESR